MVLGGGLGVGGSTGPVAALLFSGPLVRLDTLLLQEPEQVEMPASQALVGGGCPCSQGCTSHPPPHPAPVQVQLASPGGGAPSTPRAPQQSLEAREQQEKRREVADGAPHASELRRSPRR